ncbi:MAG: hypothetical protein ACF8XB_01585 [Planctomycetota bacterium JB042]
MSVSSTFVLWIASIVVTGGGGAPRVPADDPSLAAARERAVDAVRKEAKELRVRPPAEEDVRLGAVEVVWLDGSGHGQMLVIGRLVGDPATGGAIETVRVLRDGRQVESDYPHDDVWALRVRRRTLEADELRGLLLDLAAISRVEVEPSVAAWTERNEDGTISGRSGGWMSSRDFCVAVRIDGLASGGGPVRFEPFAGYASSGSVATYARPAAAVSRLRGLSRDERAVRGEVGEGVVHGYAIALESFSDRFETSGWWWVRERMLVAGGRLGADAVLPYALEVARREGGEGASAERSRHHAITAMARVTGEERRFDDEGTPRPLDELVEEYAALLGG